MFDYFNDVAAKAKAGNAKAKEVLQSWADAEVVHQPPRRWLKKSPSPSSGAGRDQHRRPVARPDASRWTSPCIRWPCSEPAPGRGLQARAGRRAARCSSSKTQEKRATSWPTGDVVGTGSSRKPPPTAVIWATGDIPFVPNKRFGGVCLGGKIAPDLLQHARRFGSLPIEVDVSKMEMGDVIDIYPYAGKIEKAGEIAGTGFEERRATRRSAGRWPYQPDHRPLAHRQGARGPGSACVHRLPPAASSRRIQGGFTLAQKMVGRACGLPEGQGIRPAPTGEPKMTTNTGSQDTTGPMTRDELKGTWPAWASAPTW